MAVPLTIADAAIAIVADWAKFKSSMATGMAEAENKATTAGQRVAKAFNPQNVQRALTATGAVAGSLFIGAVGGAATFEDGLRTINTVAKLTDEGLHEVGKGIIEVSKETGKSTDDLLAGYYDLVSAGVAPVDAINVLRDSAKLATGALGTTAEAVDLVTSALNAYGLQGKDSTRVTDIFAKAVADGKVTAAELGNSIANIAPIAASAGVSLEEVSAGYALLTAKGVPAAQAATEMRAAISALLTPNKQLNDLQEQTGINFAELAKEKGLAVALEAVRKATNGNNDAFAKSLGSIEAYQFALATTGDNAAAMADQIVETSNSAGLAQEQYAEKSKSATEQGKRMAATIKGLALELGGPFVEGVGPAVMALNQLGGGLQGVFNLSRLVGAAFGATFGKLLGSTIVRRVVGAILSAVIPSRIAGGVVGEAASSGMASGIGKGKIAGAIAKLMGSAAVTSAGDKVGTFMGSKLGKAAAVAFAAVAVVEVIKTYNDIRDQLNAQSADIGTSVGKQIATGTLAELQTSRAAIQKGLGDLNGVFDFGIFTVEQRARLQYQAKLIDEAIVGSMTDADKAAELASRGIGTSLGAIGTSAGDLAKRFGPAATKGKGGFDDMAAAARKLATDTAAAMGRIRAAVDATVARLVEDATALLDDAYGPIIAHQRLMAVNAEITAQKKIIASKKSSDAEKADARSTLTSLQQDQAALLLKLAQTGQQGTAAYKTAMASLDQQIKTSKGTTHDALVQFKKDVLAINSLDPTITIHARVPDIRFTITPTGSITTKAGWRVYEQGTPYVPADGLAYLHKAERVVTAKDNAALARGATLGPNGVGGGGNTYITNNNVQVEGLLKAKDPFEVATQLDRFQALRELVTPKRLVNE